MLLSDRDIRAELDVGRVILDPYDAEMVQPASIDVRLDRWFRLFDNHRYPVIDPAVEQDGLTHVIDVGPDDPFVLHPGEFVLGSTYERVTLPDDVAARLEGKSSLGRLGLLTHSTAGFIDPGFTGHVTLELSNTATMPIKLWPGMKVGQLVGTIVGYVLSLIVIGVFIVIGIAIWALVEGILILTAQPGSRPWGVDARGVPLAG